MTLAEALVRFRRDHPLPSRTGFVLMQFQDTPQHLAMLDAVRDCFGSFGLRLLRADDHHYSKELLTNIETYLHGCGFGVAIFDRISQDRFSPNVAFEIGYLHSLKKPICILKDSTLGSLPSDFSPFLYIDINAYKPSDGLRDKVYRWVRDNSLLVQPANLRIKLGAKLHEASEHSLHSIVQGVCSLSDERHWLPAEGKIDVECERDGEFDLLLRCDREFALKISQLVDTGELMNWSGLNVIGVEINDDDYKSYLSSYFHSALQQDDRSLIHICLRKNFEGSEGLAEYAVSVLPPPCSDYRKLAIYLTMQNGIWYAHSNFVVPGMSHSVKLMSTRISRLAAIPAVIGRQMAYCKRDPDVEEKLALRHHVDDVEYIVDPAILSTPAWLALDRGGARRVRASR